MIKIINNIDELETIKKDCNYLADKIKMPLLRYEWIKNCAGILSPGERLSIIIYEDGGEIKAIVPFVLKKSLLFKRLEIIGASVHKEPCGFLYNDEQSLKNILKEIVNTGISISVRGIKSCSLEAACLNSILEEKKLKFVINNAGIPYLPVIGTWEKFRSGISASRRSSLRRLRKIAGSYGNLKSEIISPGPDELNEMMEEVFSIEAANWKKRMGTAMQYNSRLGIFFKSYAKELASLGYLRLCFLRIDNQTVAVQMDIEYAQRLWLLKIGFNEKWAKCSPGIILMDDVIKYAFDKKLKSVEFLGSDESWLHIWTDSFHDLVTYNIYRHYISAFSVLLNEFLAAAAGKIRFKFVKILSRNSRRFSNV